ncbi:MAG: GNAT family protein [Planctomycetota bacterium]
MATLEPQTITLRDGAALTLRSPTPDDAPPVLDYLMLMRAESWGVMTSPQDPVMSVDGEGRWLLEHMEKPGSLQVSAWTLAGEVIALAGVRQDDKPYRATHRGNLGISIRRPWWGRGLGRLLMQELIAFAREREGFEVLQLGAFPFNAKALRLYESLGFEREGVSRRAVRFEDGTYADEVHMSLWVGAGDPPAVRDHDPVIAAYEAAQRVNAEPTP